MIWPILLAERAVAYFTSGRKAQRIEAAKSISRQVAAQLDDAQIEPTMGRRIHIAAGPCVNARLDLNDHELRRDPRR